MACAAPQVTHRVCVHSRLLVACSVAVGLQQNGRDPSHNCMRIAGKPETSPVFRHAACCILRSSKQHVWSVSSLMSCDRAEQSEEWAAGLLGLALCRQQRCFASLTCVQSVCPRMCCNATRKDGSLISAMSAAGLASFGLPVTTATPGMMASVSM